MEKKPDPRTEQLLWELSDKMDALYQEQLCRISVSDTVRRLLERTA